MIKPTTSSRALLLKALFSNAIIAVALVVTSASSILAHSATKAEHAHQGPTFGQLIAAVNSQHQHVARLAGMTDLQPANVRMVDIAGITAGANQQALQNAQDRNAQAQRDMRVAVNDNIVIMGMLKEKQLTSANVIAVDVSANGTVWVFFKQ